MVVTFELFASPARVAINISKAVEMDFIDGWVEGDVYWFK